LTAQETSLLRRIAQGRNHTQIARELLIDSARVATLAAVLYAKLEVDGPGLATAYALAYGITAPAAAVHYESTVVMVTDMVDFTGLVQRLGDLAARRVVHAHNIAVRRLVAQHGGKEVTHTGDGMIVAFRVADEAIACAQAIQHELAAHTSGTPVSIRIGLNQGRVLPEEDRLFGAALIAAVRICARAQGGQILLSETVCRSIANQASVALTALGKVQLKGFDAPAEIYALAH
jgi:class 3 adenylate cyclase